MDQRTPHVARDLNTLARLLADTDRAVDAQASIRRALLIYNRSLGRGHSKTATVFDRYVNLLLGLGRTEAEARAEVEAILSEQAQ